MRNWGHVVLLLGFSVACSSPNGPTPSNGPPDRPDSATPSSSCGRWNNGDSKLDVDGDGVPGAWADCSHVVQIGPAGPGRGADCDDTDPETSIPVWADADGDTVTTGPMRCVSTVPAGYSSTMTAEDCNDADPEAQFILYVDRDLDGFGDPDEPVCKARIGFSAPPGLSNWKTDCDDTNPQIKPGARDEWGDSVDSNCNGEDGPLSCTGEVGRRTGCGCAVQSHKEDSVATTCTGVDLFVVAREVCTQCSGYNAFAIGNRGTEACTGGFDVVLSNGDSQHVDQNLAPGRVSFPLIVKATGVGFGGGVHVTLHLENSQGDCDPESDTAEVEYAGALCDP